MLGANAQSPLTVDTSFRFYYPAASVQDWDNNAGPLWRPAINDLVLRLDGNIMAIGPDLMSLDDAPHGHCNAVVLSETGNPLLFPTPISGGRMSEIHSTNQYLSHGLGKRYNYDGSIDWSFG